jgi:hypothetical protein
MRIYEKLIKKLQKVQVQKPLENFHHESSKQHSYQHIFFQGEAEMIN